MLHLTFILLLIYNVFKVSNPKVKLERSGLWQLDNSWRKACEKAWSWQRHPRFSSDLQFLRVHVDVEDRWNKKLIGRLHFIVTVSWTKHSFKFQTKFSSSICLKDYIKNQAKAVVATISFIIFWDFSMFYQIFLSRQGKRNAIITYKHGIYELPNDLCLRMLGN